MSSLYEPMSFEFQQNPYGVFKRLRDEHPVHYEPEHDYWLLSRYSDVYAAASDPETYSSVDERVPVLYPMLNFLDSGRHTQLRRLVSRAFTPRMVSDLAPKIRGVANELVDCFADGGQCDIVGDFAAPLASRVVGDLIGIPVERQPAFQHWTERLNTYDGTSESLAPIASNIYALFEELLEERRRDPADDLMTALLHARVDGETLSREELLGFCFLLVSGGNDTTTHLISHGTVLLAKHPEQQATLCNTKSFDLAIAEMLRFEAPAQHHVRTTTRVVELHGERIPQRASVLLLWGSANRDEREFDNPNMFDITREQRTPGHLSFGHGPHFCLGAALARLEAGIAFDTMLERFPDYELVGEPEHTVGWVLRTYGEVQITFPPSESLLRHSV